MDVKSLNLMTFQSISGASWVMVVYIHRVDFAEHISMRIRSSYNHIRVSFPLLL